MVSVDISGVLPETVSESFVAALLTAAHQAADGQGSVQVSCSVVDDQTMRELNLRHRGIDKTTDVLSFPFQESEEEFVGSPEEDAKPMLGEIIISTEQIRRQAEEHKQTLHREFALMLVHGLLHLMGYDHASDEDRDQMFALQERILSEQNID